MNIINIVALIGKGDSLYGAQERILQFVCQRAGMEDGHSILELGFEWGAFFNGLCWILCYQCGNKYMQI